MDEVDIALIVLKPLEQLIKGNERRYAYKNLTRCMLTLMTKILLRRFGRGGMDCEAFGRIVESSGTELNADSFVHLAAEYTRMEVGYEGFSCMSWGSEMPGRCGSRRGAFQILNGETPEIVEVDEEDIDEA
ncbi:hypothetical protein SADUNF_Sadunf13G0104400 [Salix dunnii]|uniref:Uncharacterized protein n=1 Tax=Salix dunnii TaxID=1413687 RepID=A0A835JJW5_9ROSI|nr:hypothetical protein SADUNF_Sadunf13G0104400 [Salix dunnii]